MLNVVERLTWLFFIVLEYVKVHNRGAKNLFTYTKLPKSARKEDLQQF